MRLASLIAVVATLAVPHLARAQGTVVEKVPGDPGEPTPADSTSDEKEIVRGSDEVEEQRELTTEKEEAASAPSAEQPAPADDGASEPERDEGDFGHMMQIGLRAGVMLSYGMSFRYDNSPFCKAPDTLDDPPSEQQSICGFGKSPGTEIALSFAPLDSIEPYVFARLAFSKEDATDTAPIQMFGLGARIYTMSDSPFKIFVEPAIAYETEGGEGNTDYCSGAGCPDRAQNDPGSASTVDPYVTDYKKDVVFHIGIGPQYDFAKYVGVYLNGGLDVGILRSISAAFSGTLGLQARVP